jgi:hypothetical protein
VLKPAEKSIPLRSDAVGVARSLDALAIVVLVLMAAIAALTFRDYGLGWDDYTHSQYGDLLVSLYSSGFTDKRAFSFVNLYKYGGGFDLSAALAAKLLPFGLFATRRLVGAAVGLVGLFVTWRLARRLGGAKAGLIALILLAACPLYYGHMFINAKDGPFAAAMAIALLGIVRAFDEYPHATPATIALCGIGVGLAIGARVMGGFAVIVVLLSLVFILAVRSHETATKPALAECGSFLAPFIPGVILAYLVMGLEWPWGVAAPLNPFRAVGYFSHFFEAPWRELFDGRLIPVPDMPRSYVPTLVALKLPELMLALGLCGTVGAIIAAVAGGKRGAGAGYRTALFATAVAALLPVLATVALRPAMYNGIRHFVFVFPPFAVLGGVAGAWIARRLVRYGIAAMAAGLLVLAVGVALPVIEMVRLHPYQYTYFNRVAGGVAGARSQFMIDYWGLSLTQASRQLRTLIDQHHTQSPYPPSQGAPGKAGARKVAVCGPHPPVEVVLGPPYSATWDPKGADFAVMLGEFYCAKLDAPILFEIVREGVVYARVYDIIGRSIPTLLNGPGVDQ